MKTYIQYKNEICEVVEDRGELLVIKFPCGDYDEIILVSVGDTSEAIFS